MPRGEGNITDTVYHNDAHRTHGSVRQRLGLALTRELQDGESVVWEGMKLARVEPKGFAIYLFAIPWTAFSLFWMTMAGLFTAAADGDLMSWAFPLFGTPFLLIGIGMLLSPFVPYLQRGRILFAVTNRRVLKLSLGRELEVVSIPASRILDISRRESADGTGSVEIIKDSALGSVRSGRGGGMTVGRVDNVHGAYEAILVLSERP